MEVETSDTNNPYFDSYGDIEIHERMLKDIRRNESYKQAIQNNLEYFKGKVVLDVGAGTGFLSIMCAIAGANKVYAVEASKITAIMKMAIKENDVEGIVQVIEDKVENIELPEKVDIIISEWMGYYLLHEGMLDSVIVARDKFLKENGLLFPENAALFASPCQLPSLYSNWDNVSGIHLQSLGQELRKLYCRRPRIMRVLSKDLICKECKLVEFSLKYLEIGELYRITSKLYCVCEKATKFHGICIWFTVNFPSCFGSKEIILDTSPDEEPTHWEQTVIVLQNEVQVEEGSLILGNLTMTRDTVNSRRYNIEFEPLDPDEEEHNVPCDCFETKCKIIKALSAQYDERDELNNQD